MCQGHQFLGQLDSQVLLLLADLLEGTSTFIVSEDRAIAEHNTIKPGQNCKYSHSRKQLQLACYLWLPSGRFECTVPAL